MVRWSMVLVMLVVVWMSGCQAMPTGVSSALYTAELSLKHTAADATDKAVLPFKAEPGETADAAVVRLNKVNDLLVRTMRQADANLLAVIAWNLGKAVDPNAGK